MVMGSSSMENSTNDCANERYYEVSRSKRPDFFPCSTCGRFFTSRAMLVHKRTCLETENCQCSACKSVSKKTIWEKLQKREISLNSSPEHFHKKKKSKLKSSQFRGSSEEMHVKNGVIIHSEHSSLKLYEENGYEIEKLLLENKTSVEFDTSVIECNLKAARTDHEYASETSESCQKKKSKIKHQTDQVHVQNGFVDDNNKHVSFNPDEVNSCESDKMVSENKTLVKIGTSVIDSNENTRSDHNFASEISENCLSDIAESMLDKYDTIMLKDKYDHDCNRKLFCCFCNEHLFWESFGLHVIQHCEKIQNDCLKCPDIQCNRYFSQPALFLTHYLVHNSDHSLECSDCNCSNPVCISSNRVTGEHGYAEAEPFHCYICLTHFSHPQTVVNHMRLHSKEMPFKCVICQRSFRQIGNLQRHMATHRGEKPYKCNECSSSFADPATLRNHERIHTGETPYVCNVCSRGFSQVGNLKRHMALHLKKDPSSSTFTPAIEMNTDENTISLVNPPDGIKINLNAPIEPTDVKPVSDYTINNFESLCEIKISNRKNRKNGKMKLFTCKICNKVYAWQHDLSVHFRTHTGEKPYKCELCGKQFAQSGAVRIHKDRHHSGAATSSPKRKNNLLHHKIDK